MRSQSHRFFCNPSQLLALINTSSVQCACQSFWCMVVESVPLRYDQSFTGFWAFESLRNLDFKNRHNYAKATYFRVWTSRDLSERIRTGFVTWKSFVCFMAGRVVSREFTIDYLDSTFCWTRYSNTLVTLADSELMDVNANSKLKRKKKTHGLVSWEICWLVFRVGVRIVR